MPTSKPKNDTVNPSFDAGDLSRQQNGNSVVSHWT